MVAATAVPKANGAMKFQAAAQTTAQNGRRTRVETMVAMELAASCQPLVKSNAKLMKTMMTRRWKLFTLFAPREISENDENVLQGLKPLKIGDVYIGAKAPTP